MATDFLCAIEDRRSYYSLSKVSVVSDKGLKKLSIMPFNIPLPLSTPKVQE